MSGAIPEADWRVFRSLHPIWIDRFCKRVNGELLRALSDDSRDAYQQYSLPISSCTKGTKRSQAHSMIFGVQRQSFKLQSFETRCDHRRGTWTVQRVNTRFAAAFLG